LPLNGAATLAGPDLRRVTGLDECDVLLAGTDPVAIDYVASKHILLPLGGYHVGEHDPDAFSGLVGMLADAESVINAAGGIGGAPVRRGDENIAVIARDAVRRVLRRG
jgi:hypothetical protein